MPAGQNQFKEFPAMSGPPLALLQTMSDQSFSIHSFEFEQLVFSS